MHTFHVQPTEVGGFPWCPEFWWIKSCLCNSPKWLPDDHLISAVLITHVRLCDNYTHCSVVALLGCPTLVGRPSFLPITIPYFFPFHQLTVLSSQAVDGQQTYFGGSVIE